MASSRESSASQGPAPYRVLMLGAPAVGKSSLVSQFMTSEYLHAYDTSIGESALRHRDRKIHHGRSYLPLPSPLTSSENTSMSVRSIRGTWHLRESRRARSGVLRKLRGERANFAAADFSPIVLRRLRSRAPFATVRNNPRRDSRRYVNRNIHQSNVKRVCKRLA